MLVFCAIIALSHIATALQPSGVASRRAWFGGITAAASSAIPALAIGDVDRWQADPNLGKLCVKRNPLGRCDVYADGSDGINEGTPTISSSQLKSLAEVQLEQNSNALITQLRKKTEENRARNEAEVAIKEFTNSDAGLYGPFSRKLPVLKLDGGYELISYRKYDEEERLGHVKDKKYLVDIDAIRAASNSAGKKELRVGV